MKRRAMTLLLALCLIFTLLPFAASAEDSTAYNVESNYKIGVLELSEAPTGTYTFDSLKETAISFGTSTAEFPIITGAATDDVLMEFELDEDSYVIDTAKGYPNVVVDFTLRMSALYGFQASDRHYVLFVFDKAKPDTCLNYIYWPIKESAWGATVEDTAELYLSHTGTTELVFQLKEYNNADDAIMAALFAQYPDELDASDVFTQTASYYGVQYDDGADDNSVTGMPETKVVAGGKTVAEPEAPTRAGYDFEGWYNGDTKHDFSRPVTSDITLTAKWREIFTVTLVYGNGDTETVPVKDGATYALPAASRPGYIFLGWKYGDKTCSAGDEFTVNGDMTFTAVWANMPDITPGAPDEPDEGLPFKDVREGQWFYEAVEYVYGAGIMDGTGSDIFAPNGTLTRAMAWTILARLDGVDTDGGATWYSIAQEWAIAKGISDGTEPMADITREQLVTMLYRFAEMNGADVTQGGMGIKEYKDYAEISDWALTAMVWAVNNGVIEGDAGLLRPTEACTRAEAAAILMRSCDNIL